MNRDRFTAILENWDTTREELKEELKPTELALAVLKAVGAPASFVELNPPILEADVKFAFLNAPLMRKRFTVGDLLLFLGLDREKLWHNICDRLQSFS